MSGIQLPNFYYNGQTKNKNLYGANDEISIKIFQYKNTYNYLLKKESQCQKKQWCVVQEPVIIITQDQKENQSIIIINSEQEEFQLIIQQRFDQHYRVNNPQNSNHHSQIKSNRQPQLQPQYKIQEELDDEGIYCEQCGTGPFISASFYRSHFHYKHEGKIPSKNITKIQKLMGIETDGKYINPINQDDNYRQNKIKLINWNVGSLKHSAFNEQNTNPKQKMTFRKMDPNEPKPSRTTKFY